MTEEERKLALHCLKASSDYHSEVCEECVNYPNCDHTIQDDVTETIIKVLEQEPCEDCVRRQAVIDAINANCVFENEYNLTASRILNAVEALPSVTPKPKTGRWTEHFDESGKWYECDQCHTDWGGPVNYCPNCGAKMEGDKR